MIQDNNRLRRRLTRKKPKSGDDEIPSRNMEETLPFRLVLPVEVNLLKDDRLIQVNAIEP